MHRTPVRAALGALVLLVLLVAPASALAGKRPPTYGERQALMRFVTHEFGPRRHGTQVCYGVKLLVSTSDARFTRLDLIGHGLTNRWCHVPQGGVLLVKRVGSLAHPHWKLDDLGTDSDPFCTFAPWQPRQDLWALPCRAPEKIAPSDGPYYFDAADDALAPSTPTAWLTQYPRFITLPAAAKPPGFSQLINMLAWSGPPWGSDPVDLPVKLTRAGSTVAGTPATLTFSSIVSCVGGLVYSHLAVTYNGTTYTASNVPSGCTAS